MLGPQKDGNTKKLVNLSVYHITDQQSCVSSIVAVLILDTYRSRLPGRSPRAPVALSEGTRRKRFLALLTDHLAYQLLALGSDLHIDERLADGNRFIYPIHQLAGSTHASFFGLSSIIVGLFREC
jgi:hypothetical protein